MLRALSLLCCVSVGACTLPPSPPPEVVPVVEPDPVPAPSMARSPWSEPLQFVSLPPTPTFLPEPPKPAHVSDPSRPPAKPERLIRESQQAALVHPTSRCYFAGSSTCRFIYQPQKLYTIHVSYQQPTKITLPQGYVLASQIGLDKDQWAVSTARVGTDLVQTDVIFIQPLLDVGTVDVALLTTSGLSFDVHLVVGKIGMFAVTFEIPPIVQMIQEEEPLFPRPAR